MTIQPTWETEIDTPATVAVLGGGAVGIEAALYARFLGYYVLLIEGAKMAQSWRSGAHLPMRESFAQVASPLGIAALEAHRPERPLPDGQDHLTGLQLAEEYLVPLARTDLLSECVQVHSRVMSVSRVETRRESQGDIQDRADIEYRLAVHSKNRGWYTERADIVLDCTGVGDARWLGPGGGMAAGQLEQTHLIDSGVPDLRGKQRSDYAAKRTLLVGATLQALENLLQLIALQREEPGTKITWLVPLDYGQNEPSDWIARLTATSSVGAQLCEHEEVRLALAGQLPGVVTLSALGIERMTASAAGLNVCLQSNEDSTLDIVCDRILASTGKQPNWDHVPALRVGQTPVLARPCLELTSCEAPEENREIDILDSILTMEPHYYVLGSKSLGLAHEQFTLAQGHQQIRRAFALIGGRENLDLYTNIQR